MPYPKEIKFKAKKLRQMGYSLDEIASNLKIAKSTASLWLSNVFLDKPAKQRLENRSLIGLKHANETRLLKKTQRFNRDIILAKNIVNSIKVTPLLAQIYCSLLYWAEGGKFTDSRLEFTNSDPKMINSFLKFLRKGFQIQERKLRANIHLHEYHNPKKQRLFWSKVTKIPLTQFNKNYLKPHTKKIIRKNYQGCVRICYYDSDVAHKIKALYTTISEIE